MVNFEKFWNSVQQEIEDLKNPSTGLINGRNTVRRDCVACLGNNSAFLFEKYGFIHVKCYGCSLIYTDPVLSPESLEKLYTSTHSLELYAKLMTEESKRRRDRHSMKIVNKIKGRLRTNGHKWLDFGCGYGGLLKAARTNGFQVNGVEPGLDARNQIKKELEIEIEKSIHSEKFEEGSFDVITLKQVIEHLFNPSEIIKRAYRLLRPGGVLWIATPNTNGLGMKVMGEVHPSYQRGHINMFNHKSMKIFLHGCGFMDTDISSYSLKTLHLLSFLRGNRKVREDIFRKIDKLPQEGGARRFAYYKFVVPTINVLMRGIGKGDYIEVFAHK